MNASSSFSVSAPGSLMLMGEHAVLHGHPALCMAVEPRITIEVTPRKDREIHIDSSQGALQTTLDTLPEEHSLGFVLVCIQSSSLSHGFEASIHSELDSTKGLGTSAAVTVAMTAALQRLEGNPFDPGRIVAQSLETIRKVQGRGSGCDAAASTYGGIVRIDPEPFRVEPIHASAPFFMAYAGYKVPTPEVIELVEGYRKKSPVCFEHVFAAMESCVTETTQAVRLGDWDTVGQLMTRHHYLQGALGTSDATLDSLVHTFLSIPHILGAKISGSGLGDSVLALGNTSSASTEEHVTPVTVSEEGVRFED